MRLSGSILPFSILKSYNQPMPRVEAKQPDLLSPLGTSSVDGEIKDSMDPFEEIDILKHAMRRVSERVVGREQLVIQTLFALLTREHQLIFSRTGTAKSLYGRTIFSQFDGELFSCQLTQGTTEETLVGAYDLERFKQGSIWHRTDRSIVTADFAFLDEFLDANDMVMRTLLGILNEREFSKGEQQEKANLHTAIATANYVRRSGASEAVLDRLIFKAHLRPDGSHLEQLLIDKVYEEYNGRVVIPGKRIPVWVLRDITKIIKGENPEQKIAAPNVILFLKNQLVRNYIDRLYEARKKMDNKAERPYVSPRTIAKIRDVMNASAMLHGRTELSPTDLYALEYVLTTIQGSSQKTPLDNAVQEEEIFFQALNETAAAFSEGDLKLVDIILALNEFYDAFMQNKVIEAKRRVPAPKLFQKFAELFGFTTWSEVREETFISTLNALSSTNRSIQELRDDLKLKIQNDQRNRG